MVSKIDKELVVNQVPADLKIYHITHVENLPAIVQSGQLWSDRQRIDQRLDCQVVGMQRIKRPLLK